MILGISEEDARSLISVFSALLAAFGFFYTGVKDEVHRGLVKDPLNDDDRASVRGAVRAALWPGLAVLSLASAAVASIMLVPVLDAVSIGFRRPYSPSKAALVVLGIFWLLLALYWGYQFGRALYRCRVWK